MSDKELVDLQLFTHAETELGLLLSDDGIKGNAVWVPKSQIDYTFLKGNCIEVAMPVWLAKEKEFI